MECFLPIKHITYIFHCHWIMIAISFCCCSVASHVRLFATPWSAARQAPLPSTISWSLFKFISIESVMPSNHLILCHPLLLLPSILPSIRVSSYELALPISIGASPSASILSLNIQSWFPLGLTGLISLALFKGLSRVFSTPQLGPEWREIHQFSSA